MPHLEAVGVHGHALPAHGDRAGAPRGDDHVQRSRRREVGTEDRDHAGLRDGAQGVGHGVGQRVRAGEARIGRVGDDARQRVDDRQALQRRLHQHHARRVDGVLVVGVVGQHVDDHRLQVEGQDRAVGQGHRRPVRHRVQVELARVRTRRAVVQVGADQDVVAAVAVHVGHDAHLGAHAVGIVLAADQDVGGGVGRRHAVGVAAEVHVQAPGPEAAHVGSRRAHQQVAVAVAVQVARAVDGAAQQVAGQEAREHHVGRHVRVRPAVVQVGAAGVEARGVVVHAADDDVVPAVAVEVARGPEAVAEPVAERLAGEDEVGDRVEVRTAAEQVRVAVRVGAHQQVVPAVAVEVAGAVGEPAQPGRGRAGHRVVSDPIEGRAAIVHVHHAGPGIGARRSRREVVAAAVQVAGAGHRPAQLLAARAGDHQVGHRIQARPAEVQVEAARVVPAGIIVGRADQHVVPAVVVDVAHAAGVQAELVAVGLAQEGQVRIGVQPRTAEVDVDRARVLHRAIGIGSAHQEVADAVAVQVPGPADHQAHPVASAQAFLREDQLGSGREGPRGIEAKDSRNNGHLVTAEQFEHSESFAAFPSERRAPSTRAGGAHPLGDRREYDNISKYWRLQ